MKKRMLSLLLTAVMLFAAVSMAGLRGAAAATVISNVKLTYSASGVSSHMISTYTEGELRKAANMKMTATGVDSMIGYLVYKSGSDWIGIGEGKDKVNPARQYGLVYVLEVFGTGYDWPDSVKTAADNKIVSLASVSGLTVSVNGTVNPAGVEIRYVPASSCKTLEIYVPLPSSGAPETTISSVSLAYDKSAAGLIRKGKTDGDLGKAVSAGMKVSTAGVKFTVQGSSGSIIYFDEKTNSWCGIGEGGGKITAGRKYYAQFLLFPDGGYKWPSSFKDTKNIARPVTSLSGFTVKVNGAAAGSDVLYVYRADNTMLTVRVPLGELNVNEVTVSGGVYKLDHKKLTATFIKPSDKNAKSLSIPDTVSANGKTYKVTEIKAKACKGMKKLATLTLGANVTKIGSKAFADCKKLKKITIKCAKMKKSGFGSGCFSGIKAKATFKVPKKMLKQYKEWIVKKGKAPKTVKVKK